MKEIGTRAFYPSKLRSAVFPKSLEKIGCEAFYHNESMRRIEFNSMVSIDEAAFAGHPIFQSVKKPKELVISENVFEQNTSLDKFGFGIKLTIGDRYPYR